MLAAPHIFETTSDQVIPRLDVTEVFRLQHGFVWRVLARLGVAPAELEDALQEVFVVVHRRLEDYREQGQLRGWLYGIAVHVAKDNRRRIRRRREQLSDQPLELSQAPSQAAAVANRQALVFAERMLEALPEKQRAVFLLYEVEQLPMAEVAAAVGCPVPTAYARLRKARERVFSLLSRARLLGDVP